MDTAAADKSQKSMKTVPISDGATPKESTSVDDLLGNILKLFNDLTVEQNLMN